MKDYTAQIYIPNETIKSYTWTSNYTSQNF